MVSSAWRLRRALQAESAELGRARAAVLHSEDDDPSAEFDENVDEMGLTMRELGDTVSWLRDGGDPCEDFGGGDADEDDPLLDAYGLLGNRRFPEVRELRARFAGHPRLRDVRGVGLIAALEPRDPENAKRWQALLLGDGVITRAVAGAVALSPPLTLAEDELDELVAALQRALEKLA